MPAKVQFAKLVSLIGPLVFEIKPQTDGKWCKINFRRKDFPEY